MPPKHGFFSCFFSFEVSFREGIIYHLSETSLFVDDKNVIGPSESLLWKKKSRVFPGGVLHSASADMWQTEINKKIVVISVVLYLLSDSWFNYGQSTNPLPNVPSPEVAGLIISEGGVLGGSNQLVWVVLLLKHRLVLCCSPSKWPWGHGL